MTNRSEQHSSRKEINASLDSLDKNWRKGLMVFKEHNLNIYELPWYLLLGEPFSGKTELLKNSNLNFPLGFSMDRKAMDRLAWVFTDQGIILDTAEQLCYPSENKTDTHEWRRLLKLLAKHRPMMPINGVVQTIPISMLLNSDLLEIKIRGQRMRQRLTEIGEVLSIHFPVFVMISKCDLLDGFTEYFENYTDELLQEVFGWSQLDERPFEENVFYQNFDMILLKLRQNRMKWLTNQKNTESNGAVYPFPEEFATLRRPLACCLTALFQDSHDKLLYRGCSFSSALQKTKPIIKDSSKPYNTDHLPVPPKMKKSYFVRNFFIEKVFAEQGLVTREQKAERKDAKRRLIARSIQVSIALLGVFFLIQTYWHPKSQISFQQENLSSILYEPKPKDFFDPGAQSAVFNALAELDQTSHEALTVMYLDRFLFPKFELTNDRLRSFDSSMLPTSDTEELVLKALANYEAWQVRFEQEQFDDTPDLIPFLNFLMIGPHDRFDTDWENMALELQFWFERIYSNSSPELRYLIFKKLIGTVDDEPYRSVAQNFFAHFKQTSPGKGFDSELLKAWNELYNPPISLNDFHGKIEDIAKLMSKSNISPSLDGFAAPGWVDYINDIMTHYRRYLPDPLNESPCFIPILQKQGFDAELAISKDPYPVYIITFWEIIGKPYFSFIKKNDPFLGVRGKATLDEKIRTFLYNVANRIAQMNDLWRNNLDDVIRQIPPAERPKAFKKAIDTSFQHILENEQSIARNGIERLVLEEGPGIPEPPTDWSGYVQKLEEMERLDFKLLTKLPDRLAATEESLDSIFESNNLKDEFQRYSTAVKAAMNRLHETALELDAIEESLLARNQQLSIKFFPQSQNLIVFSNLTEVPWLLKAHHNALMKWTERGFSLFHEKIKNADSCPQCQNNYENFITAIKSVGMNFPLSYRGMTQINYLRANEIEANLADTIALDHLFGMLSDFRNMQPAEAQYLQNLGILEQVKTATTWSQVIKALIYGDMTIYIVVDCEGMKPSIASRYSFVRMDGFIQSAHISLKHPGRTQLRINEGSDLSTISLIFFNQNHDSFSITYPNLETFLAWSLEGYVSDQRGLARIRNFDISVDDINPTILKGRFILITEKPILDPPDWAALTEVSP